MAETVSILGRRCDEIAAVAREARQRADATAAALAELTQQVARLSTAPVAARRARCPGQARRRDRARRQGGRGRARQAGGRGRRRQRQAAAARRARVRAQGRGRAWRALSRASLPPPKRSLPDAKALAPLEPFAATGVPSAPALARELAALTAPCDKARSKPPARRRATASSRSCRRVPRSSCACVRSRRSPATIRRRSSAASRSRRRRPISPARSPSWRSCRRRCGRRPSLDRQGAGARRRRRGEPRLRRRRTGRIGSERHVSQLVPVYPVTLRREPSKSAFTRVFNALWASLEGRRPECARHPSRPAKMRAPQDDGSEICAVAIRLTPV